MSIAASFLERSRYYLCTEYPVKVRAAVEALPQDRLWWRPNEQVNSVGNLLLHLSGNVRQWIVSGVGGQPDVRKRNMEFAARGGATAADMLGGLDATLREADAVLRAILPSELLARRSIQGRDTTVMEAVYHVVEHFAGHTGQIIWIVKMLAPGAIRFYEDGEGIARPLFLEGKFEM
ncbi:MAG TPA: DinB family protein [Gemmatimonadaceae bacterium]|nr:DinB family protein [Gemmatimonadaceae bacterium]